MRETSDRKAASLALLACVLAAALEGAVSGTNVESQLASMRMPPLSPPLWAWYAIGAGYYVTFFFVLYRVIRHGRNGVPKTVGLWLIAAVLVANAVWNWTFFGSRDVFASLVLLVPYNAVVLALMLLLARVDRVAMFALAPYATYLIYAAYWTHGVWRVNA